MPAAIGLSSKVLDVRHWFALSQYADATLDIETGQWKPKPEFSDAMVVCCIALERWNYEMQAMCGMEEDDGKD